MSLSLTLVIPAHVCAEAPPVRMAGTEDNPLFCLADVCQVLGISNPRMVADRLDDDEKATVSLADGAGGPPRTFITEAGLYTVLLRSDKPAAKPFRKWVTGEVLPSIRRHGQYPPPPADEDHIIRSAREGARALNAIAETRAAQLLLERKQAELEAQSAQALRMADAAMKAANGNHGYVSVLGWLKLNGAEADYARASTLGKLATRACRDQGLEVRSMRDQRFGSINLYPESVLDAVLGPVVNRHRN